MEEAERGRQAEADLIYIYVHIDSSDDRKHRYFILTKSDVQKVHIESYKRWMDPRDWIRPRNPQSYDNRIGIDGLEKFENNWELIKERLISGTN